MTDLYPDGTHPLGHDHRPDWDRWEALRTGHPDPGPRSARPLKIYVASSWRNVEQPKVIEALRGAGHDPYDFRNPREGDDGFSWKEVGGKALGAHGMTLEDVDTYLTMIEHPRAIEGFDLDFAAMVSADAFVLVLPSGRSAHLEAGWAIGAGKPTAILLEDPLEPELMYRMAAHLTTSIVGLLSWLERL